MVFDLEKKFKFLFFLAVKNIPPWHRLKDHIIILCYGNSKILLRPCAKIKSNILK